MTSRRNFFKNTSLVTFGSLLLNPFEFLQANPQENNLDFRNKKAKNIIFLVSDGMSNGTLSMANLYLQRTFGKTSNWLQLYAENKVSRALMDTSSANSIVTDSAAGGSSWGGGFRVNNGSLNAGTNGEMYTPIWQKFKKVGKKVGCVTTVPITHATPASFCTAQKSRNSQDEIAEHYLQLQFDVMMGGGAKYFTAENRKDKRDLVENFKAANFEVVLDKKTMLSADITKPILGLFAEDGLPYSVDHKTDAELTNTIPTLAEMTQKAIEAMQENPNGFALQVEAGKVDWAAHGNDIAGLLYDQVAFDNAIKVAIDFAEKDKNTLVIICTDHGNANPGLIYGNDVNKNFDTLQNYKYSNDWILQRITNTTTVAECKEKFAFANGIHLSDDEAKIILENYKTNNKEEGVYNYKKIPFKAVSEIQKKHTSVGWISMDHSSDHVEVAAFGPGSHLLKPFIKNTDLHYLMLDAAEVENKF